MKFVFVILSAAFTFSSIAKAADIYQAIYDGVNTANLELQLKSMTGYSPVTVAGRSYAITNRYAPSSKADFRAYWTAYFQELGIPVQEFAYKTEHHVGETEGHNLEAVLEGRSPDSVVIIVHYDSIGEYGKETENPGVDDDMTGMSIMLETARILAPLKGKLEHTVRFVAADYEEHASPGLEGARQYAQYISSLAKEKNFKIVSAIDNEQSGWNCAKDGLCGDNSTGTTYDVFTCSGDARNFNSPELGVLMSDITKKYSSLVVNSGCIGQNSDHYAMWEIGVPAVVYSEHNPFANPHFDQNGGDTLEKIDFNYFNSIARIGVTMAARMIGIAE